VIRCAATSPLKVLVPKNHGEAAWLFLSSFGGGLVDGDALRLELRVGAGACAYLSTQASTKVYRGASSQSLDAEVAEEGLLCALPDPVVCFAGASFRQSQVVRLAAGASLVWLDSVSGGRIEHGERWQLDRYESRIQVEREGLPVLQDALRLDAAHGDLGARMRRFTALATLAATGPRTAALRTRWLERRALARSSPALVAASPLGADLAVVRIAAVSTRALTEALGALLDPVPALLGDDPFARKW